MPAGASSASASRRAGDQARAVPIKSSRSLPTTEHPPMTEQAVTIPSAGLKLAGTVRLPAGLKPGERRAAFLVLHGFGSNQTSSNVMQPTKVLTDLGYVTLGFDMRGCGDERRRARQSDLPRAGRGHPQRAHLPGQAPCGRSRSHRRHRLELRRRGRGLRRRRRCARRRRHLQRRLGRRRAQVPRPAQGPGGVGALHRHAGTGPGVPRQAPASP